jgi:hypothetical protein
MTPEAKRLMDQMRALAEADRLELAVELLASVAPAGVEVSPAEWERLWSAEADRRWRELAEGERESRDAVEVLSEARARLS